CARGAYGDPWFAYW
nr:immunoglobulin heavy chain junction region [Mus musculus]